MNVRTGLSLFSLALTLACGGGGGGSGDNGYMPPSGPPANTVWVGGSGSYGGTTAFNPATLTVPAGTSVAFSWQGGTHTVTSYAVSGSPTFPGVPNPGQSSGTYSHTFATAGTYYYYCEYHGTLPGGGASVATGMAGKIVVQ